MWTGWISRRYPRCDGVSDRGLRTARGRCSGHFCAGRRCPRKGCPRRSRRQATAPRTARELLRFRRPLHGWLFGALLPRGYHAPRCPHGRALQPLSAADCVWLRAGTGLARAWSQPPAGDQPGPDAGQRTRTGSRRARLLDHWSSWRIPTHRPSLGQGAEGGRLGAYLETAAGVARMHDRTQQRHPLRQAQRARPPTPDTSHHLYDHPCTNRGQRRAGLHACPRQRGASGRDRQGEPRSGALLYAGRHRATGPGSELLRLSDGSAGPSSPGASPPRHPQRSRGPTGPPRSRPASAPAESPWRRDFNLSTALVCSWETRDSVTPSTSPISRKVRFS